MKRRTHFICPRRVEDNQFEQYSSDDFWTTGFGLGGRQGIEQSCSYCGSLHPDTFMKWVLDQAIILPTDKNYKCYARCPYPDKHEGQITVTKRPYGALTMLYGMDAKFYFQHLSLDQRLDFISLMNDKTLNMGTPGYFYNMPFFVKSVIPESQSPRS